MRATLSLRGRWTPERAYLMGLLCSQAAWERCRNGRNALDVASADLPLLYWLRSALRSRARIRKRGDVYRMRLTNQRVLAALARAGAASGLAALVAAVPSDHHPHLVRGYFDSRGKVSLVRVGGGVHLRAFLPATAEDADALASALKRGARAVGALRSRGERRALMLSSADSLRLHDWMYRSACFYLEAKKTVFERYVSHRALASA